MSDGEDEERVPDFADVQRMIAARHRRGALERLARRLHLEIRRTYTRDLPAAPGHRFRRMETELPLVHLPHRVRAECSCGEVTRWHWTVRAALRDLRRHLPDA
jgi:hypothetical protein